MSAVWSDRRERATRGDYCRHKHLVLFRKTNHIRHILMAHAKYEENLWNKFRYVLRKTLLV